MLQSSVPASNNTTERKPMRELVASEVEASLFDLLTVTPNLVLQKELLDLGRDITVTGAGSTTKQTQQSVIENTADGGDEVVVKRGIKRAVNTAIGFLTGAKGPPPDTEDPGFIFTQTEITILSIVVDMKLDGKNEAIDSMKLVAQQFIELSLIWEEFTVPNQTKAVSNIPGFYRFILFVADGLAKEKERNPKAFYTPIGKLMETAKEKDSKNTKLGLSLMMQETVKRAMRILHGYAVEKPMRSADTKKRGLKQVEAAITGAFGDYSSKYILVTKAELQQGSPDLKTFAVKLLSRLYHTLRFMLTFDK